jgi:hypothetical protein
MAGEGLSDVDFLRAMVKCLGTKRTAGLIGSCIIWQLMGVRTYRDIERQELGERSTWYRARRDLRAFREYLIAEGEDPGDVEAVEARVARGGRQAA